MRALTQDEYALLGSTILGSDDRTVDGARRVQIADALTLRGCYRRTIEADGTHYRITDLGRLALRVSRPEMAFQGLP